MRIKIAILLPLLAVVFFSCVPSSEYLKESTVPKETKKETQTLRILLMKTSDSVKISSQKHISITESETGKVLLNSDKGLTVNFSPEKVNRNLIIESDNAELSVNGTAYRGSILLSNQSKSLFVINEVSMRDYLISVVPSEIIPSWDMESLKAQSVASRTYAVYNISKKTKETYDLDSNTNSQMYKGIASENPRTTQAVNDTANIILVHDSQPIEAFFHSTCGGRTIDAKYVWSSGDIPYLHSAKCEYCKESNHYTWETHLSVLQIRQALSKRYNGIGKIQNIVFKKKEGRVISASVKHSNGIINLTGNQFRLWIDPKTIKSLYFNSALQTDGLKLSGKGWGHGVGLCQWGSKGMADLGWTYDKILKYYYPNTQLNKNSLLNSNSFGSAGR